MATAVRLLDFETLPGEIAGLGGYDHLFALIRFAGRPVAMVTVPVQDGRVRLPDLEKAIKAGAQEPFWRAYLAHRMGWSDDQPPGPCEYSMTVAVCTRDRPGDLRRCLEGMAGLPDDGQEVIVVDSASRGDDTRLVVEGFPGARYVREELPGLNRARNRAIHEARGEIIAFIDDDAVPDKDWLRALARNYSFPAVYGVSGLTAPAELETTAQEWYERYCSFMRGFWKIHYTQLNIHPMGPGPVGAGVNMSFRKSVFDQVGLFDLALDAGTPTLSGGDTEMLSRILANGLSIVYDPAALSWHWHRRSWRDLRRTVYGYGVGTSAFWARKLFYERELDVLWLASGWILVHQVGVFLRSLFDRPGSPPIDLIALELAGYLVGPWAYYKSRRANRRVEEALLVQQQFI